jgi:hypothetical protein
MPVPLLPRRTIIGSYHRVVIARKHKGRLIDDAPIGMVRLVRSAALMPNQPKTGRLKSRDPGSFKGLLVRMNLEGWRELRKLAAERDTTLNALAIEAFNDLLKKRGKQPLIQNPLAGGD